MFVFWSILLWYQVLRNTTARELWWTFSFLTVAVSSTEAPDEAEVYKVTVVEALPVKEKNLRLYTQRDPVLSWVLKLVQSGWRSDDYDPEVKPYLQHKDEISVHHGEILVCRLSHSTPETQSTKGILECSSMWIRTVWWPNLDKDISLHWCTLKEARDCLATTAGETVETEEMVETLHSIFSRMGLTEQLVSDNGSLFTSVSYLMKTV